MAKKKCLLLNQSYETLNFITFERAIKLVINEKVEVVETWDDDVLSWANGKMKLPAVLRLKRYIKFTNRRIKFNRRAIFRRDSFTCQYCSAALTLSTITIDHVLPKRAGGRNNWENCVSCCGACNRKKRDRTPEEAGMQLLQIPTAPQNYLLADYLFMAPKHSSWNQYFE